MLVLFPEFALSKLQQAHIIRVDSRGRPSWEHKVDAHQTVFCRGVPVLSAALPPIRRSNSAPVLGVAELATPVRARSAPDLGQESSLVVQSERVDFRSAGLEAGVVS